MTAPRSFLCWALALVVGALGGLGGSAWAAEPGETVTAHEYRVIRDIAYADGDEADPAKQKLDLILPRGKKDFPVVFFVHGGAWQMGDRDFFGIYSAVGMMLARHGIGVAVPSYRLSPAAKHPDHIKDVARAFAWTHKNIARYGGRPDQLFACGHSAGGHLVALLCTDESHLKAEGLDFKAVKGAIPISGVYMLPDGYFTEVFGNDREVRKNAWPLSHVKEGCPDMLLIYAEKDYPALDQMAHAFCGALQGKKCQAEVLEIKQRNHNNIVFRLCLDGDPTAQAMLGFIAQRTKK